MGYNICLAIGICLVLASLYTFKQSLNFLSTTSRALGTVMDLEEVNDSEGGPTFRPVFHFSTAEGQEIVFRPRQSSNPPSWRFGEDALIAYHPDRPDEARIVNYLGVFSWSVVLMAAAMPLIVIGGGYYVAQYFLK